MNSLVSGANFQMAGAVINKVGPLVDRLMGRG